MTTTPTAEPGLRLFGGKGGVGKTTCATAFAIAEARRGSKVLVASTDPAHSLGDALGLALGRQAAGVPVAVAAVPGLSAVEIDADAAWQRWLAPRRAAFTTIAERGTYFSRRDLAPLLELRLPGVDELLGLLETVRLAREDGADCLVVDTAPTGHTLRMLESPATLDAFASVLDAMEERHRALSDAFGAGRQWREDASADGLISDLRRQASTLYDLLRDAERTRIVWVLTPEPLAIAETATALHRLSLRGLGAAELVVNRIAAVDDCCAESLGRTRAEWRALEEIRRRFPGLPHRLVAEAAEEPTGPAALARLGEPAIRPAMPAGRADARRRTRLGAHRDLRERRVLGRGTRLVLVGGKGGVGKSTCAAALAVAIAHSGTDGGVDLVSTDPAPSLAHLFGMETSPAGPVLPSSDPPGLRVQELDAEARFADLRSRLLGRLDRVTRHGDDSRGGTLPLERSVFESLVAATPPGLDELIALGDLAERLADPASPCIVVDLSPTGHALRLLELPDLALSWLRAVMKLVLDYRQVLGLGDLAEELLAMSKSVRGIQRLLRDPQRCVFVVVTGAASLVTAETRRLLVRLEELGVAVEAVIVNAVVPAGLPACAPRRVQQDEWIGRLARGSAGARGILLAPIRYPQPEGVQGLRAWHEQWTPLEP